MSEPEEKSAPEADSAKTEPKPEWEKRAFKINDQMIEVVNLGIKTTEVEIASLKRKLAKLQYGA